MLNCQKIKKGGKRRQMKSMSVRQVGALAAGAVMIGAAVSGAVSAGLDTKGLSKGFFYDASMDPKVQIVVGEKGKATDAVAAGNVAATIGNLAYATKTTTVGGGGTAAGEVTIGVSAMGATGKFKQNSASNTVLSADFYNDNTGLTFGDSSETYQRGEFVSYSLACDVQERTEAGILKEGTYNNIHCLFCQTLCLESLENPEHEMKEEIKVNYDQMHWYEFGIGRDDSERVELKIDSKAVSYSVDTGEIPMTRIGASASPVDFEWRGKMILFGEEYYVKDIKGNDEIYLAKGKILDDISSEGYTSEYMGYKFKIDHLIYSAEYEVAGILLDIEKPDGTVVQTQISKMANGIVDDIEVSGVYAEEADQVASASVIVYDATSNIKLEDGKDIELGGSVKKYWRVKFATNPTTSSGNLSGLETTEYNGEVGMILENISMTYRHKIGLLEGMSLDFPSTYKLTFDGFRTNDFRSSPCSGEGEGNIKLEKDSKYQLLLSFTDDGGNRWDDIRLDQGPFARGDRFVIGGKVFEYDDSEEATNDTSMKIILKNLIDGGKEDYYLHAVTSPTTFYLQSIAFDEGAENDDYTKIQPDAVAADTDVFINTLSISGVSLSTMYDGGDLYLDVVNTSSNDTIGVSATQLGGCLAMSDFEINGNSINIGALAEGGTDANDFNEVTADQDTDDVLIIVKNEQNELVVVDLYDRDFNDTIDLYYDHSVKVFNAAACSGLNSSNEVKTGTKWGLQDDADTVLILPKGGDSVTVDYGGDFEVEAIEVCHPQEEVDATTFIGTSEEATVLESTITEADVGTTKTAGCCTFTVEAFSVSGAKAGSKVAQTTVNAISGNLVVPEIGADASKNLVIVGGPAVNGMTTVTADEIAAASNKYIVRRDGKKLIVAGWTASDTVDAGNALVDWLNANIHK